MHSYLCPFIKNNFLFTRYLFMQKIILSFLLFNSFLLKAQDSLPGFSVINKGNNRVVISWNNKYAHTRQITIQRSADSLTNFKSIASVPDPMNRQNGYLDAKAPDDKMFYRLYILVEGSNFIFTKSKRPVADFPVAKAIAEKPISLPAPALDSSVAVVINKIVNLKIPDSTLSSEEILILKKIRNNKLDLLPDSVSRKIDAVIKMNSKPAIVIPVYRIISNREGLVQITLNDFQQKKYSIKFFEDDGSFLFEIKNIKEALLLLDKSNFYHSGWFKSELYDDGKLVEKNRFFIPKDF